MQCSNVYSSSHIPQALCFYIALCIVGLLYLYKANVTNRYLQTSMSIKPGKWFYLTASFSQKSGLTMYEDGKVVSRDEHGTPGGSYPIDEEQTNFCIGRNVGNVGTVFARFYMSSFATFKEELSPDMVGKVYSFFWRQGRPFRMALINSALKLWSSIYLLTVFLLITNNFFLQGPTHGKTFYIVLHVKNTLGKDAFILPSDNLPAQGFKSKDKKITVITKTLMSNNPIQFSAVAADDRSKLFFDDLEFVTVKPTHDKSNVVKVTLTETGKK